MAMFEFIKKDGIQQAHSKDFCMKCYPAGTRIDKSIEYEEVFKLYINGLEYCLCMDHLKAIISDKYVLIPKENINEGQLIIEVPMELAKNGTEKDVLDFIKRAIK